MKYEAYISTCLNTINQYCRLSTIKLAKSIWVAILMLGVVACGGGSGSANTSTAVTTITSLSPVGAIASATPLPLGIYGTNFSSGISVNVTDKYGFSYTVTSLSVQSSTTITADVSIPITPADNYVNVTLIPIDGTSPVSTVLGVTSTARTLAADVQPILDANCGACHDGSIANGFMDMSSYAATASANPTGLIGIPSYNCAPKFRLIPGDPRRTSSVIIDKIQAHFGFPACSGDPMPPSFPLSGSEIQTIIDWVAGGAN